MRSARWHASGLVALVALLTTPGAVFGVQSIGRDCEWEPGSGLYTQRAVGTSYTIFQRDPRIRCQGGVVIRADSLAYYGAANRFELIGDVFYGDSTRTMTAVRATYRRDFGQLVANGAADTAVVVTDLADGARLTGLNLDYREAGGGRLEDEVTVYGRLLDGERPSAVLPVAPSPEAAPDDPAPAPFDVTADRIFLRGENYFEARGTVDAVRDSLVTRSDSLIYDQVRATLDLGGRASLVQGIDSIEGRRIIVRIPENEIREIEAIGEGSLVSRDLDLEAPWFRVAFSEGEVDGLWAAPLRRPEGPVADSITGDTVSDPAAAPPGDPEAPVGALPAAEVAMADEEMSPRDSLDAAQPVAWSGATRITADSLDVAASVGVLDSVLAIGRAYAVSSGDSINASMLPEIAAQDWIRGDTIIAKFLARQEADSTVYSLDRIVSGGNASSLYRLAPEADAEATDSTLAADLPDAPVEPDSLVEVGQETEPVPQDAEAEEVQVILPADAPGVHYVVAGRIVLVFVDDEVSRMEIYELREGVHLEPRRRTNAVADGPGGAG